MDTMQTMRPKIPNPMDIRVNVRLTSGLHDQLVGEARRLSVPIAEVIREACRIYFETPLDQRFPTKGKIDLDAILKFIEEKELSQVGVSRRNRWTPLPPPRIADSCPPWPIPHCDSQTT